MARSIKKFLEQPHSHDPDIKRKWITIFGFGLFVVIFSLVFHLHEREGVINTFIVLGFGLITIFLMTINWVFLPLLIPRWFHEDNWTVAKEIFFHLWNIFLIGLGNLLYSHIGGYYEINLSTIIKAQITTILVGIFPITFIVLLKQNRLLKKHMNAASEFNKSIQSPGFLSVDKQILNQLISLSSEGGKDRIQIQLGNLLFLKSVDNYVEVYWDDGQGTQKELLRSSLKRIEDNLKSYSAIFRCHRTYLVNMKNIDRVMGNSQGYKLIIKGIGDSIPVSRSYTKTLRQLIAYTYCSPSLDTEQQSLPHN